MADWIRPIADLLIPPACMGCKGALPSPGQSLCIRCQLGLSEAPFPRCGRCDASLGTRSDGLPCVECERWPAALVTARAAVRFEGPAISLVHGLKYEGWTAAAQVMAERMAPLVSGFPDALLVPVPTTPQRARVRGYNQAEVIARKLMCMSELDLLDALERPTAHTSQTRLGRWGRVHNVAAAFRVKGESRAQLRGRSVLLIDDVLTTGATAGALAGKLATVGVPTVSVLTFSRAATLAVRRLA